MTVFFKKLAFILFISLFLLIQYAGPALATTYTATSAISVTVSESTTFTGPGNWTAAGQAPGSTYGPTRSTTNISWLTNAASGYIIQTEIPATGLRTATATWTNHTGTIAAPTALSAGEAWGFSLSNIGGTAVATKWNNGLNYAAFPTTATTVYTSSAPDTTGTSWSVYWKAMSLAATQSGTYTTTVTWTYSTTP